MKGKMKKIIAGIATLAMAAQFAFVMPASAATGDVTTVIDAALTSTTLPTIEGVTWGSDVAGLIVAGKGLRMTNANKAANNYSNKSFVTFAAAQGSATSKLNISYDVAFQDKGKVQAYTNFTMSYYDTDDKFLFEITESVGGPGDNSRVEKANIKYATSATETQEVALADDHIGKKVSADVSYDTDGNGYLALDGDSYKFYSGSTAGIKYVKLTISGGQDWNRGIDIKNYKITATEVEALAYRTVSFTVDGTTSTSVVQKGVALTDSEIPSTTKLGYIFRGWSTDGSTVYDSNKTYVSNDNLKAAAVDDDVSYTAVYSVDEEYIHTIADVKYTAGTAINQPAEGQTAEKTYTVNVISDTGDDISQKEGMTITWSMVGAEKDDQYVGFTHTANTAKVSVASGVERSYFGYIQAVIEYDPANSDDPEKNSSKTIQIPYAILQNTTSENFIPATGYPVDFNSDGGYADTLVGYKATVNGQDDKDIVMDQWTIYGSNGSRTLTLKKEEESGDKYFEFASNGGGGSTVGIYRWTSQSTPYILETTVNMPAGARMTLADRADNDTKHTDVWSVTMNADSMTVYDAAGSNATISDLKSGTWYKLLVVADPVSMNYYAKVLDEQGNTVGESDIVTMTKEISQKYVNLASAFPINMKTFRAYNPTVTAGTISGSASVKVPEDSTPATSNYVASFTDADGNVIPTSAKWSLAEEKTGVSINESTGVLTVSQGAAGKATIKAVSGAAVATKEVRLVTSANAIDMTGPSAITIPFAGSPAVTATYTVQTIGPDSQPVAGDAITYRFLKKDGATAYDALPNGITFNESTGVLTVTSDASPALIYLEATNKEGLVETKSINIHGRSYVFGTTEPSEDSGETLVGATQYTDVQEYGFEATAGLTANANDVTGTAAFKFQVKVPNGNYKVEIKGELPENGVIYSEAVGGGAVGTSKGLGISNIAVCDGILDLTFPANAKVASVVVSQITSEKRTKPAVFAIGDSTTKNSGHYRGYDATSTSNDHKSYGSWGNCVTEEIKGDTFSQFTNKGNAGKNSASYYNLGDLESVLLSVCPGDYVTINMGINSMSGADEKYETLMENYYVQGVIQRGGIPVILTHTPDGVGFSNSQSTYDEATGKFDVARATNGRVQFLKGLATKYADDGAELIDVGLKFQNYFNQLEFNDKTYAMRNTENENGKLEGYVPPANVYELVRTWYPDHNHYTPELGDKIAKYVFHELAAIANDTERDDVNSGILPFEDAGNAGTPVVTAPKLSITADNAADFTVKVGSAEKADGDELAKGDVITIEASSSANVIVDVNSPFAVSDGKATYTVTGSETTITISNVTVAAKPSDDFAITFNKSSYDTTANKATITAEVTGTGTQTFWAYVAQYDSGKLVKVERQRITISDTNKTAEVSLTPTGAVSADNLKVFVWGDDMLPYLTDTSVTIAAN